MKSKRLLSLLLLSACSKTAPPVSSELAGSNGLQRSVDLGSVFDDQSGNLKNEFCVVIDDKMIKDSLPNSVTFGAVMNSDYSRMQDILNAGVDVGVSLKKISVKGSLDYASENASTDLSSTITVYLYTNGGERRLSNSGGVSAVKLRTDIANLLNSTDTQKADKLVDICGTSYVAQVSYGTAMAATFKIDWHDKSSKEQFDAFVQGEFKAGSISADMTGKVKSFFNESKRSFNVSVGFQANGMNALKVGDVIPDGKTITQCNGMDPDACLVVFEEFVDSIQNYKNLVTSGPSPDEDDKFECQPLATPVATGTTVHNLIVAKANECPKDTKAIRIKTVDSDKVVQPINAEALKADALDNMAVMGISTNGYKGALRADNQVADNWPSIRVNSSDLERVKLFRSKLNRESERVTALGRRANLLYNSKDERIDANKSADLLQFVRRTESYLDFILRKQAPCFDLGAKAGQCLLNIDTFDSEAQEYEAKLNEGVLILARPDFYSWCKDYNQRLSSVSSDSRASMLPMSSKTTIDVLLRSIYSTTLPAVTDNTRGPKPINDVIAERTAASITTEKPLSVLDCDQINADVMTQTTVDLSAERKPDINSNKILNIGQIASMEPLFSLVRAQTLILNGQNISKEGLLGISNMTALRHLSIANASLVTIGGVGNLPALEDLNLEGNSLTSFEFPAITDFTGNTGLRSLKRLNLANNALTRLDLAGLVSLESLNLTGSYNPGFGATIDRMAEESSRHHIEIILDKTSCDNQLNKTSSPIIEYCPAVGAESSFVLANPYAGFEEHRDGSIQQGWQFRKDDRIFGKGDFDNDGREEIVISGQQRLGILQKNQGLSASLSDRTPAMQVGEFTYISSRVAPIAIGDFTGDGKDDFLVRKDGEGYFILSVEDFSSNLWKLEASGALNSAVLKESDQILGVANLKKSVAGPELLVRSTSEKAIKVVSIKITPVTGKTSKLELVKYDSWSTDAEFVGIANMNDAKQIVMLKNGSDGTASLNLLTPTESTTTPTTPVAQDGSVLNFESGGNLLSGLTLNASKASFFDVDADGLDEILMEHAKGIAMISFRKVDASNLKGTAQILPWGFPLVEAASGKVWVLNPRMPDYLATQRLGPVGNYDNDTKLEVPVFEFSNQGLQMGLFKINKGSFPFLTYDKQKKILDVKTAVDSLGTPSVSDVPDSSRFEVIRVNHDGGVNPEVFFRIEKLQREASYPDVPFRNFLSYCVRPNLAEENIFLSKTVPALTPNQLQIPMRNSLTAVNNKLDKAQRWQSGITSCVKLHELLSSVQELDLSSISMPIDLRLLNYQTQLRSLSLVDLGTTNISRDDRFVKPLGTLSGLEFLDLRYAGVKNVEPLNSLSKLNTLNLYGNKLGEIPENFAFGGMHLIYPPESETWTKAMFCDYTKAEDDLKQTLAKTESLSFDETKLQASVKDSCK